MRDVASNNSPASFTLWLAGIFPLPMLPVLMVVLVLFAPLLLTAKAMFWGTPGLQFVPWWDYAWGTLLSGELPLWNPFSGMGAPLAANYQTALFYPPNWLYLVLHILGGAPAIAWGISLLVIFHLSWAGLGMALLVRRLGLSPLSQAVAGLAFGLCGYLVSRAGFLSINAAAAWLPWVLLALTPVRFGVGFGIPQLVRLVCVLCFQLLAGHAQTTWYTWLLAIAWAGFLSWNHAYTPKRFKESPSIIRRISLVWGRLALAIILACGVAAIQVLPTAEYLAQSQRASSVGVELAMTYSFWPWRLLTLFAPDLFGNPAHGDYWGYANYWEDNDYIGLLPLLLALGAALGALRRGRRGGELGLDAMDLKELTLSRRMRGFLVAVFGIALLLSLGSNTPVFPWLYQHIPTFDLFQAPTRIMLWAEFSLVMLSAIGAQTWRRPQGRGLYWIRLGTAGAFAVALGSGLAWFLLGEVKPTFIVATSLAGLWGLAAGMLSLLAPTPEEGVAAKDNKREKQGLPSASLWSYAVLLVISADLYFAGRGLNPGVDLDFYRTSQLQDEKRSHLGEQRLYLSLSDEQRLKFDRFLRFDTFIPREDWVNLRGVMLPNLNLLDRVPSANNFDPLQPARYTRWMEYLDQAPSTQKDGLLALMDIGNIETIDEGEPNGVRFDTISGGRRLRLVDCVLIAENVETAWELTTQQVLDFATHVVLEREGEIPLEECSAGNTQAGMHQAVISRESSNQVVVNLRAEGDGWLVLSDMWYPGWQARLDGKATPVQRANFLFRAVSVPAGEHEVEFLYRPNSYLLGLLISLFSAATFFWTWRKTAKMSEPS